VETASAMTLEALKQLDDRIQASVNRIQQLQRENEALVKRLAESEQRFNEAQARSSSERQQHETERGEIKARIEKILARFDGLDLG
jgi:predicted  nucleic acid-binding Zn-ribbon protein